jgi:hypothetical protein
MDLSASAAVAVSAVSPTALPRRPYVGPRAFRPGEKLHGRSRETRDLTELLASERIVLCHSPSGAGKTSLIQARLIPALSPRFAVHGPARVSDPSAAEVPGANRYVLSLMVGMEAARLERFERAKRLEHRRRMKRAKGVRRIRRMRVVERMPSDALAKLTLAEYLDIRAEPSRRRGVESEQPPRPEVLIFDQFEEILTLAPHEEEEKTEFFRQVGEALCAPRRRALFAIREEYVAALDPFIHWIPTRLALRYPLGLLNAEAAREAIEEPAKAAKVPFTPEALDKLVDNLLRAPQPGSPEGVLGRYVEPVQLQVVCTRIWQNRPKEAERIEEVGGVGDVDTALADYYAETVSRVARDKGVSERDIRLWFGTALISGRVRAQVAQGSETAHRLNEEVMKALVDAYLVRREERRTTLWYELAHDRLVGPILDDNARWFDANASWVQRQAQLWMADRYSGGALVRGRTLKRAKAWATANPNEVTREIEGLLAASDQAQGRRSVRTAFVVGVGVPLLIGAGLLWQEQARTAERQDREQAFWQRFRTVAAESPRSEGGLQEVVRVDSALEAAQARGDSIQGDVRIWYFPKEKDPDIKTVLGGVGFSVESQTSRNNVPTNFVFYGDSVRAGTLRLLALALLRASVPVKGICPLNNQVRRGTVVQVLGMHGKDSDPVITVDQVSTISDASKQVNCASQARAGRLTVYLQFYGGGDEAGDRQRVQGVQRGLNAAGFNAPGVDSVMTERANEVRYTDVADRPMADSVGRMTARLLGVPEGSVPARRSRYRIPRGHVEVWLDLTSLPVQAGRGN